MKNIKIIALFFLLPACVEVGFKQPQPQKGIMLETIPKEIIAYYSNNNDTTKDNNLFKEADINVDSALSENAILKKWKGNYFYNQKKDSLWYVIMIKPSSDKSFDAYQLDGGKQETLSILKGITTVEEIRSKEGEIELLIIDPSPSEFKRIIKSNAFEKVDIYN